MKVTRFDRCVILVTVGLPAIRLGMLLRAQILGLRA
jgi:hypothetical protein